MRTRLPSAARLLAVLLFTATLSVGAAQAQGLGILAGANYNQLSDIEGDREATFDNASGYHVGVFYDLSLGPLSLRPAIVYVDVGEFDFESENIDEQFDLQLVEVPVDARFRFGTPLLSPYVMAGPVFRFNASDNEGFEDAFEEVTVAGNVGFGLELSLPGVGLTFYPEFRYQFGLTQFFGDEFTVGGEEFTPSDDPKLNAFMLRLGVAL